MVDEFTVVIFCAFLFVLLVIGLAWLALIVERELSQGGEPWKPK